MPYYIKRFFIASFVFCFCLFPFVTTAVGGFVISDFKSDLNIQSDGSVQVRETITADFNQQLRGIYRDIPVVYNNADGSRRYTRIDVKSVSDRNGHSIPYETSDNDANLRIKIGDANRLVSAQQIYVIRYVASGVVAAFPDHDELYWNVTGNDWEVPMTAVSAIVTLPTAAITNTTCYVGSRGSRENCAATKKGLSAQYASGRGLSVGEGLTAVAAFPKGTVPIITIPEPQTLFSPTVIGYVALGFFLIIIPAAIFLMRRWWLKGRDEYYQRSSLNDPQVKTVIRPLFGSYEPIVPEYDPPAGLRPAEIGVLLDERADPTDISATVVDLAVRGYLKIEEIPKEGIFKRVTYRLIASHKATAGLLPYEEMLQKKLFAAGDTLVLSEIEDGFYKEIEEVKKSLYEDVTQKKLFADNPEEVRNSYKLVAWVFFFICPVFLFIFFDSIGTSGSAHTVVYWLLFGVAIGAVVFAVALSLVAGVMPKRTAYGRDIYRQSLGYKLFVSGTEKYRQPFFEKNNIFMEVLPYAMVFGVTEKLARAMQEMQLKPNVSSWYIGPMLFNMNTFRTDMNNLTAALSTHLAIAPSSSGSGSGGFSGGGFGGGGGGGW